MIIDGDVFARTVVISLIGVFGTSRAQINLDMRPALRFVELVVMMVVRISPGSTFIHIR